MKAEMMLKTIVVWAALIFLAGVRCGGKFELKLKRFKTGCRENEGLSSCDIYFKLCLQSPGTSDCNYLRKQTGVWDDTSTISFGTNMRGVANPMVVSDNAFQNHLWPMLKAWATGSSGSKRINIVNLQPNTVQFSAEIWDADFWTDDDHVDTLSRNFTQTPVLYKDLSDSSWNGDYFYKGHNHMWVDYRLYCDPDYYTEACNVYCKPQNSPGLGYYTCDETTGQKLCLTGWTGSSCTEDVNECLEDPCYNGGTCINTPGAFRCQCAEYYTGDYCEQITSLCHSSPCKNGGLCDGDADNFTCTCPPAWTGQTCEEQISHTVDNSGGKFELKLKRFTTGCKEHLGASNCDIYFKFCLKSPGESSCNYLRNQTGVWEDTSTINFGTNMRGVANPMVVSLNASQLQQSTVEFSAQIWEEDFLTGDDHLDTLSRNFTQTPMLYKELSDSSWKGDYFYKGRHLMWVDYRLYCNPDYYTAACNVYCKAQNSTDFGHYSCNEATGQLVCLPASVRKSPTLTHALFLRERKYTTACVLNQHFTASSLSESVLCDSNGSAARHDLCVNDCGMLRIK